ncbi:MAG: uroporphyrinogen decarboxylase family protein [Eubacteriales bacterium]|nr:uroporphyrinogen decarboxylase family protein [Eubacteriales bacterium]
MDKRTRVLTAMNGGEVDHVPAAFWFHFAGAEAEGDGCVQAHLNYYKETDLDFVKIMCDGYFPFPVETEITCAADWAKLKALDADHPFVRGQVERAKAIVKEIGQDRCVFYNVFAPFSSLRFGADAIGIDDAALMKQVREDKNAVMKALDAIGQTNALLAELLITEAGCDGIYYCVQSGEYDRFTQEEYKAIVRPSDLYVLEHANRYSENNIMHMCGWAGNKNQLTLWKDYPAKVMNWAVYVEGVTLDEGRMLFGGKTCLGGFETHWDGHVQEGIIYNGTKEELQEYTRSLILNHGKKGLMLGGDCTIDAKIDWQRLKWIVEAARSL